MKIEQLKAQKIEIEKKIKKLERVKAQKGLYKRAKEVIGECYKFNNGYSGESERWYIYAIVKDVVLKESSVYMVLDKYELTKDNEIKISINSLNLDNVNPMHCWQWINKEIFDENKELIVKQIIL